MDIVLASQSPRRKEILARIVQEFEVVVSSVNESEIKETDPVYYAMEAARLKARDVAVKHPFSLVIGADTVVVFENKIIGKPEDKADAQATLKMLSGKQHFVISGLCLLYLDKRKEYCECSLTRVVFNVLTDKEIDAYLGSRQYMDKAGSYAIQDIGNVFIKEIEGSYDNVVGFPTELFCKMYDKVLAEIK